MKKIIRIEVRGAINTSWEGSSAKANAYLKELKAKQEHAIMDAIGEKRYKAYIRDWNDWQKNPMRGRNSAPSLPYTKNPFPLTIKIT